MDMQTIHLLALKSCIGCIAVGALVGIIGIWTPEKFWDNGVVPKSLITTAILFAASLLTAGVTKWLS